MSLIYSALKPVLRTASAKRAAMTREDFVRQAEKKQRRPITFPEIAGYWYVPDESDTANTI